MNYLRFCTINTLGSKLSSLTSNWCVDSIDSAHSYWIQLHFCKHLFYFLHDLFSQLFCCCCFLLVLFFFCFFVLCFFFFFSMNRKNRKYFILKQLMASVMVTLQCLLNHYVHNATSEIWQVCN